MRKNKDKFRRVFRREMIIVWARRSDKEIETINLNGFTKFIELLLLIAANVARLLIVKRNSGKKRYFFFCVLFD